MESHTGNVWAIGGVTIFEGHADVGIFHCRGAGTVELLDSRAELVQADRGASHMHIVHSSMPAGLSRQQAGAAEVEQHGCQKGADGTGRLFHVGTVYTRRR